MSNLPYTDLRGEVIFYFPYKIHFYFYKQSRKASVPDIPLCNQRRLQGVELKKPTIREPESKQESESTEIRENSPLCFMGTL